MISQETAIKKTDLDQFPFPEPENEDFLNLSEVETILMEDVLSNLRHLGKAVGRGRDGNVLHQKVGESSLQDYGKVFCRLMNQIYEEKDDLGRATNCWESGFAVQTRSFTVMQFKYGKPTAGEQVALDYSEALETSSLGSLENLLIDKKGNQFAIQRRIVRVYRHEDGYDLYLFYQAQYQVLLASVGCSPRCRRDFPGV